MTSHVLQRSPSEWSWLDILGVSQVQKGEQRRFNGMYDLLLFFLLLYASYTWNENRRCVFDRCSGHENVVVVQFPAVHQPHTHTPRLLAQRKNLKTRLPLSAAAVLQVYLVLWLRS